jgi:hypothetical protein
MYIVTVKMNGSEWPLRGTNWAYDMSRAQTFETRDAALAALNKAKKFMKAAVYKAAVIKEIVISDSHDADAEAANYRRQHGGEGW